jgi:hypothetical protein
MYTTHELLLKSLMNGVPKINFWLSEVKDASESISNLIISTKMNLNSKTLGCATGA